MDEKQLLEELGQLAREQESAPVDPALARPLDAAARDRLVARLSHGLAARPEEVPERRRPKWARRLRVLVPAALAAGLLVVLARVPTSQALPGYSFEVTGGVAEVRSTDAPAGADEEVRLAPGTRLVLVLRPERAERGAVDARLFLEQGQTSRPVSAQVERSGEGALRVTVTAEALMPAPGTGTMAVVLARPDALPQSLAPAEVPARTVVYRRKVMRQ